MKLKIILSVLCFLPVVALAQTPPAMNQQNMQQMMGVMNEVQACYQKIDQGDIKAAQQRSQQFMSEMQALCKNGKRDEAQTRGMAFAMEMMNDKVVKQIQGCAEKIPDSLKSMITTPVMAYGALVEDKKHVCDY